MTYAFGVIEDGRLVAAYAWQPPAPGAATSVCPNVIASKTIVVSTFAAGSPGKEKSMTTTIIPAEFQPVFEELAKSVEKFPTWPTDPLHALGVVHEEVGELSKEVLQLVYEPHKTSVQDVRKEALQAAAMALRFYLSLETYTYAPGPQHAQHAAPTDGPRFGWNNVHAG